MASFEDRLSSLPFDQYRAHAKGMHTTRLGRPWYIRQGDLTHEGGRYRGNDARSVWHRQVRRYAAWYLAERHGVDVDDCPGWIVTDDGRVILGSGRDSVQLPLDSAGYQRGPVRALTAEECEVRS